MKIVIAGSMSSLSSMERVARRLIDRGHSVTLPDMSETERELERSGVSSAEQKKQLDVIRTYYKIIEKCDALVIVNDTKRRIDGYIGGNTFLEMGFAYALEKPIYVLNPVGNLLYTDEILAMEPIVLNGDLSIFDA